MERAYSVLTVRNVGEDQREITGVATTPTTDRYGDVIESLGIAFRNPLPLLLYHDTKQPVGTVTFHQPTKDGISFTAKIAQVLEPGRLRDRVEEAWQSIKARLIRGVSIGFRPVEFEPIKGGAGLRFLKTEVLELSLVVVPANVDATITAIRSYALTPTATGPAPRVRAVPPGDTGSPPRRAMNYSEQITNRRADLRTAHARLEQLETQDSLNAQEQTEQTDLVASVRSLTSQLERLETLEAGQARLAAQASFAVEPVRHAPLVPPPSPHHQVQVRPVELPPGIEYARYAITLMAARVTGRDPVEIARQRFPDQPRIQHLIRAAVAGGTTTDPTWAGALVDPQNLASEFIEYLRPRTIVGRVPGLRRVPFNVRIIGQTSGGSASWVGQAQPKPLTKFDYAPVTLGFAKIAAIAVFSEELARFSSPSAETLVRDGLSAAVIERMDVDFIDPAKAAVLNVSPASITNGVAATTSAGTDADAIREDVQSLMAPLIAANLDIASAVWIMSATTALSLSLMRNTLGQREFDGVSMTGGGTFAGLPVVVSQHAAIGSPVSNMVILAVANEIFLSDDGQVSIDASREASLEMSDNPASDTGTVVSMYQTNQIALRAERFVNWAKRRADAVQYIADANWGE